MGSIPITRSNLSHQRPAPAKASPIGEERSCSPALACIGQFSHARWLTTGVHPWTFARWLRSGPKARQRSLKGNTQTVLAFRPAQSVGFRGLPSVVRLLRRRYQLFHLRHRLGRRRVGALGLAGRRVRELAADFLAGQFGSILHPLLEDQGG